MKKFIPFFISVFAFAGDNWSGVNYNKNSTEQKAAAERTLSSLTFSGNEKVLDIGCGDGYLTSRMAEQLKEGSIVGLDLSPSMIDFASSHFANSHLQFRVLDARQIDYENEFDLITSFTAIHFVPEQLELLQKIEKALHAGGKLIVDMQMALPAPLSQAVNEMMMKEQWVSYFADFSPGWRFFTAQEYEELLDQAKLQPSKIQQTVLPHTFPSKVAFIGFLRQWFPYLRPLPEDRKMAFLEQVVDRYLELFPADGEGRPTFEVSRLRVEAEK